MLAVARRLLDDEEALRVVGEATDLARELVPLFRSRDTGAWVQGLVVGLAVARTRTHPSEGRSVVSHPGERR